MSNFLFKSNGMFKFFLNNYSWFVYSFGGLLILLCIYYYIYDCKRKRTENFERTYQRVSQRRRPGAVCREHEIFRNAIKTVHQYIDPNANQSPEVETVVLRRTRSGAVYGRFNHNDEN